MTPYQYLMEFLYVLIICNVNVLFLKIKELKELKQALQPVEKIGVEKKTKASLKRAAELYLNEKYLRVVKRVEPGSDSKSIVDRATKRPLELVLADLDRLDESDDPKIREFVEANFHETGFEIVAASLPDWSAEPQFLTTLRNEKLRVFAAHLNSTWLHLCKRFDYDKLGEGCVSSHLHMKHMFVVPGGRFREIYYWDTYWTLEGLFVCGLVETARLIIENFMLFIDDYGFIPNGSRVYYLNRSQPPYFCQMVVRYLEAHPHAEKFVLDEVLPRMIREYEFWMVERSVRVRITTKKRSRVYKLNLYKVNTSRPRPESYYEDLTTASQSSTQVYTHIASAAESGYDFSSRWLNNPADFSTIQTSEILPVDLNALMYKNEMIIGDLLARRGDLKRAQEFRRGASRRRLAMNKLMWCARTQLWCDVNIRTGALNTNFYVTNLSPLWVGMRPPVRAAASEVILGRYEHMLERFDCGVPVSMIATEQQWDYNNVWAPNQHSIVVGLMRFGRRDAALTLARKFFRTVYHGWLESGAIFEKYDVCHVGKRGRGGEYEVQSGFGWTNGCILSLINLFGDELVE